ncbi:MAG: SDR family oxidoreductase [Gammaproteobacteria bacterium]|nr:SDR family oxidoreductase [Gammaproteobacteria bacterium]MCP5424020.1 SDR family oxidoreductase [Gammaproteobacteria bacterium]MCP5459547.1 SDR family oxidoreductase [Gammaproteobacteria bacterium]
MTSPTELPQTALITGASAGIGQQLAKIFAEHGFDLVIVSRRRQALEALARQLHDEYGVKVVPIACDLVAPQAPLTVFQTLERQAIEIDVLVNNAGINHHGAFKDIYLADHLELIQLNIVALTTLTHLFLQPMLHRRRGRILNVSSLSAFQPVPTLATYSASKAYVLALTEALANELRDTGVTATALCPGFTDTAMLNIVSATTSKPTPLPGFLVGNTERVARDGYAACMAGEAVCVSGRINQMAAFWMRHQPAWAGRFLSGVLTRKLR